MHANSRQTIRELGMSKKLDAIEVLRAVAAIAVVLHHAIRAYTVNLPNYMQGVHPSYFSDAWLREGLSVGVDIFFVISGFIMVFVAQRANTDLKGATSFLIRRIDRIYPPYIIATILLIVSAMVFSKSFSDYSLLRVISSILLFPTFNELGLIQPILGVGWTLSYEMYFYLIFSISMIAGKKRHIPLLIAIISMIWVAAVLIDSETAIGIFLQSPLVFEFILGCLIAQIYLNGALPKLHAGLIFFALASIGLSSYVVEEWAIAGYWRPLYWGLPSALLVAASLRIQISSRLGRAFAFLGAASYATYLVHMIVIYYWLPTLYFRLASRDLIYSADQAIVMATVLSIVVGILFHLFAVIKVGNIFRVPSKKTA